MEVKTKKASAGAAVTRAVRHYLATGRIPDDADGTLAAHVADLERRVRRVNARGGALAQVRLSPELLGLQLALEANA